MDHHLPFVVYPSPLPGIELFLNCFAEQSLSAAPLLYSRLSPESNCSSIVPQKQSLSAAPVFHSRLSPFACPRSLAPVRLPPFACPRSLAPVRLPPFFGGWGLGISLLSSPIFVSSSIRGTNLVPVRGYLLPTPPLPRRSNSSTAQPLNHLTPQLSNHPTTQPPNYSTTKLLNY